ncbi:MAG: c-type cytochrome [Elusimicrobia bacterium]|nr:c-type cytochrome [Elusimicrobiota bacterium]
MIKNILLGAAAAIVSGLVAFYLIVSLGFVPANADATPPKLEKWIARKALHAAIDRQAPKGENPVALNDANLVAGIKLYAADCAVCHGAADGKASHIASGLYQRAPQLAKHGVEDDEDGETYWKIFHGIRMTGMPGFSKTLTEGEIWTLALFLKHMDKLTPAAQKAWVAVPSSAR